MFWTRANEHQLRVIEDFCHGKEVLDLGGYDGSLGSRLAAAGADSVTVIDKEPTPLAGHPHVVKILATFREFDIQRPTHCWQTGILSWPMNNDYTMRQVLPILARCREIVYLGSNRGGTQCGTPLLWSYLVQRQIHSHIAGQSCTVIIYTDAPRAGELIEEERLALDAESVGF